MPQITALKKQLKNSNRVSVYLDNRFAFGLSRELSAKLGLFVGKKLSAEKVLVIKEKNRQEKTLALAYRYLSYRPRSGREISDYLVRKGIDKEQIGEVVSYLKRRKYLDDEEFAYWWLEQRNQFRPRGRQLLKQELLQKGISREIIDRVLVKVDEKKLAKKLIVQQRPKYEKLPPFKAREKLISYLGRRGFSWQVILETLEHTPR